MPHARLNGVRLHYEVSGAGDAVLLLSGLGGAAVGWLYQVRDLSPHYRVITLDNRGAGESELPAGPVYRTADLAEDAAALLAHLGVRRAHVVGASMGGTVAMELALRHPTRVRSLALCCTWGEGDGRFLHTVRAWMALAPGLSVEARFRDLLFPWLYTPAFLADPARREDALRRVLAYPFPTRPEGLVRQGRGLLEWSGSRVRELRRLRVPALVVVGREDILTPPAFSRALARILPRARLRVIAGAHACFIEEAARFNRALLAFLRSVRR